MDTFSGEVLCGGDIGGDKFKIDEKDAAC